MLAHWTLGLKFHDHLETKSWDKRFKIRKMVSLEQLSCFETSNSKFIDPLVTAVLTDLSVKS